MTLAAERGLASWTVAPAAPADHPLIADFLATTVGIAGRKFAADSRDVAEQFDDALPEALVVARDQAQRVRGYAALHEPHGQAPEHAQASPQGQAAAGSPAQPHAACAHPHGSRVSSFVVFMVFMAFLLGF